MIYESSYGFQNLNGDYMVTATDINAGSASFSIELDASLIKRPGRYVVLRAGSISNYAGATASFVGATSLNVRAVSQETVTFPGGTAYACVVVTVA
jgi:hypothetical protein